MARDCILSVVVWLLCGYVICTHTFSVEALRCDQLVFNGGIVGEDLGIAL